MGLSAKIILYLALFFLVVSFLGFVSAIRPPRINSSFTPADFNLDFENISFETEDGKQLAGWWLANFQNQKAIILMHGYPADKGDILPALAFLAADYNLLFFDFRGLGQSRGLISTAGLKEQKDLRAALDFLQSRGFEQSALWGFSMGAAVALSAVNQPAVQAIVADSSYASLELLAPELYRLPFLSKPLGWLTALWARLLLGIDIQKNSPAAILEKNQVEKPIFIIHSTTDEVIPFSHALILKRALGSNNRAEFWFREGRHGFLTEEYERRIKDFLARNF